MAVLEALASAGGEVVTREEFFEKVWPGVIVTDDALTQCIVELRKAFGDSAQDARVIRTLPRVGFCLVPEVTELVDDPPGGFYKHRLPKGRGYRGLPIRTSLILVAALLLVLVFSWYRDTPEQQETVSSAAVAVLPFADLSEAGDQQWFADGLTEELINMLARVDGLSVTNRTSSFHFRDPDEDLRIIADTLGVSHVLEGSVRRQGKQLRVTAQLIDAASGYHLWSEAYDRELEDVLALQQDISEAVVQALMENLGYRLGAVPDTSPMVDYEAYDAVLMGRYLVAKRTLDNIHAAVREFEKAIAIKPDYALAHAELAMAIQVLWFVGVDLHLADAKAWAEPHAEKALALDANLAEAWLAAAWIQEAPGDRLRFYEQAIRINPNHSIAHTWLARGLRAESRYQESFDLIETAIRLDPLSIPGIGNYVWDLVERRRFEDARRQTEKLALLSPGMYTRTKAWLDSQGGKYSVFALGVLEDLSINPERRTSRNFLREYLAKMGLEQEALTVRETNYAMTHQLLGNIDDAVSAMQSRFEENPDRRFAPRGLGLVMAAAGHYDQARPLLEKCWQENDGQVNRMGEFRAYEAVALISIRKAAGDDTGELLAAMHDYVNRLKAAGITGTTNSISVDFLEGITFYLSGEREAGLALLARAVENGAFILPNEAYLQTLYEDPDFVPIMARQRERQRHEREAFLAVVCNYNPYREVWQPAAGTCEKFLGNP